MKIRVMWVGKTRERFAAEGIDKYAGMLKPFAELQITVLKDEKGADIPMQRKREGERILAMKVPYVLLDETGTQMTSREFARFIERRGPALNFVLGGAYGVSDDVKTAAAATLALSKMTLTHEFSRVLLLEQIYRAFTIIHKRGYHH